MAFFLALYVLEGLSMMVLAVPLIQKRIKPNRLSGFRVPETLRDEATWYRVNAISGRWLFGLGAAFSLLALGLYVLPGIHNARGPHLVDAIVIYNSVCAAALFAGLFTVIAVGYRAILKL